MLQLLTTDRTNTLTDRKKNSGNEPQYKQQGGTK
jgi:hypothetical protein